MIVQNLEAENYNTESAVLSTLQMSQGTGNGESVTDLCANKVTLVLPQDAVHTSPDCWSVHSVHPHPPPANAVSVCQPGQQAVLPSVCAFKS